MKRILMFSLVLALLAALVISTAAFAQGPSGAGAYTPNGAGYGPGDGTGPIGGGQFGGGPRCVDLNLNGICDCLE